MRRGLSEGDRTFRRRGRYLIDRVPLSTGHAAAGLIVILTLVVAASAASGASQPASDATLPAHWVPFRPIPAVVDLAGTRRDGTLMLALVGRLSLLGPGGPVPFARGRYGYATSRGTEPYRALAPAASGGVGGSSFAQGDVYAPGLSPRLASQIVPPGSDEPSTSARSSMRRARLTA